jgi:hypothetical protein
MYMVHQRLTTAVRDGYRGADPEVVGADLAEARRTMAWLEELAIDAATRASLVEPIAIIEEALAEIMRMAPGQTAQPEVNRAR